MNKVADLKAARYKRWRDGHKVERAAYEAKRRLEKRAQCLIAHCRTRARRRGLTFDLDSMVGEIQKRIDAGCCEITGSKFDLSPGRKWNSPSIDRIDAKRGYLPDNVRVVCQAMNLAMGDWGEEIVWAMFQDWTAMESFRKSRKPSSKLI